MKEEVEQDFLETLFDTFGRIICVPQEQFPSLSFKNKAVWSKGSGKCQWFYYMGRLLCKGRRILTRLMDYIKTQMPIFTFIRGWSTVNDQQEEEFVILSQMLTKG